MGALVSPDPQILGSNPQAIADAMKVAFDQTSTDLATFATLFAPAGGTTDDAARFQALLNAGIKRIRFAPGTFLWKTVVTLPSQTKLVIEGDPNAVIKSTLPQVDAFSSACFYASAAAVTNPYNSTLSANAIAGQNTVSAAAAPAVGIWVQVSGTPANANVAEIAQVKAVGGVGPYTITLDRPLQRVAHFTAGVQIVQISPPVDILFDGRGMLISGTGDRAIEIGAAQRCLFQNIRIDPTHGMFGSFVISYDIGSADSTFRNIYVDGGALDAGITAPHSGIALEVAYRCAIDNCRFVNCGNAASEGGVYLNDTIDCDVLAYTDGCSTGLLASNSAGADVTGCKRTRIRGSYNSSRKVGGNGGEGLLITSPEIEIIGVDVAYNAANGIHIGNTLGGGPTLVLGCRSQSNAGAFVLASSDADIVACHSRDDAKTGNYVVQVQGNANVKISGGAYTATTDYAWQAVRHEGTGRVSVSGDMRAEMRSAPVNAQAFAVLTSTGTLQVSDAFVSNGSYGILSVGAGCAVLQGNGVVMVGTTNPYSIAGGDALSFGTVVANGTTGVAVAFKDIRANSRVFFTLRTIGGTVGHPKYTITAGTGFTLTSDAADTSTYEYWIV